MILTQSYGLDTRLIKSTTSHSYSCDALRTSVSHSPRMQQPTCTRLRVRYACILAIALKSRQGGIYSLPCHRSPQDAQVIFHAVAVGVLPMVTRRLDTEERRAIMSGSVFVWEERGPNPEATGVSSRTTASFATVSHHTCSLVSKDGRMAKGKLISSARFMPNWLE